MFASYKGHSEVVDKLLDKGANIEAKNEVTYLISSLNLFKKHILTLMLIVISILFI